MQKNVIFLYLLGIVLSFLLTCQVMAAVPAPPVNQELGFFETRFNSLSEVECRACHNQNPPDGIPVDPTYLPTRHHLLIYQTMSIPSVVPNPDSDGDNVPDTTYRCLSCHSMNSDGSGSGMDQNFRDCMNCHRQLGGDHHGYSPHHNNPLAQADLDNDGIRDTNANGDPVTYCSECHGSLVNDLGDGHDIPTYEPSERTPWPSGKVNGDGSTVNDRGTEAGNCNFCHDSGTTEDGRGVVTNLLSHHGAGFFGGYVGNGPCYWCHIDEGGDETLKIRKCEGCHGPDSLHNIQTDSPNPANLGAIVPGSEDAGYGHIGRNVAPGDSDCWGCHGFGIPEAAASYSETSKAAASYSGTSAAASYSETSATAAPYSGPTIPHIENFNPVVINVGEETLLTIHGLGFTNTVDGPTGPVILSSVVTLESDDGTVTTLVPDTITQSLLNVIIPSSLNAGIYSLRVEKDYQYSNKKTLLFEPQIKIDEALCKDKIITITGNAFSDYLDAADSSTSLSAFNAKGYQEDCMVTNWSDIKITASCDKCPRTVTVNSIWGETMMQVRKSKKSK